MGIKTNIVLSTMVLLLAMASISSAEITKAADITATTDMSLLGNVSGLGWIKSPTPNLFSNKAGFAFTVYNGPPVKGVLSYVDYPRRLLVLGNVTILSIVGTTATFSGTAKIYDPKGTKTGTYSVTVEDKAKPGKGNDTFAITLSTGYTASGVLQGGDIVIKP